MQCFGANASDELGLDRMAPVHAPGTRAPAGAMGRGHTCSRAVDAVRCWGDNAFGQLGVGGTASRGDNVGEMAALAAILPLGAGLVPPAAISSGAVADQTCMTWSEPPPGVPNPAPNDSGWQTRLACWGKNGKGQLGLGDQANRGDQPGEMGDALPFVRLR